MPLKLPLTDEEILKIVDGNWSFSGNDALVPGLIAKAQRKKVVEDIEGMMSPHENELGFIEISNHIPFRRWQALLDEVKDATE